MPQSCTCARALDRWFITGPALLGKPQNSDERKGMPHQMRYCNRKRGRYQTQVLHVSEQCGPSPILTPQGSFLESGTRQTASNQIRGFFLLRRAGEYESPAQSVSQKRPESTLALLINKSVKPQRLTLARLSLHCTGQIVVPDEDGQHCPAHPLLPFAINYVTGYREGAAINHF